MKSSPLLRCLAIYGEMPLGFVGAALLFAAANGGLAWQQWLIGRAINEIQRGIVVTRAIDGGLDFHRAWYWLAVLAVIALARGIVQFAAGFLSLVIGQKLLFIIRERIMIQIQRLDLAYHWRHGVGELVTRTTRDADKVRDALINFWRQVFETALVIFASVAVLCWYGPWLGLVPLCLTLAGFAILVSQTGFLVALDRRVGAAYDAVNQDLSEGVNGVRVIKAFGLEDFRIARFEAQVLHFTAEARQALAYAASRIPLPQIVIASGQVWVLAYGAWLVGHGRIHVGDLVGALLLANTLVLRVEGIGPVMQLFADARSSAARIWELLDAEPQIVSGSAALPTGSLGLRFSHVRVGSGDGGSDVLKDVSFAIEPGEIVALVGTTGSGKSTLMGLLPRLIDADSGRVEIGSDARGWQDVTTLDLGDLRRRIHVVPQESFLFSDTLANNLRLGAPDASEAELHEALTLAAADEIVDGLREGFATRIGDRGLTLSGGQRQRLCLARALIAQASILGLDDATSALDAATERRVLDNIRRLRRGDDAVTVLVVSSKLSTILLADRVLVLADGAITAAGTHESLAATNPGYRDLMGL